MNKSSSSLHLVASVNGMGFLDEEVMEELSVMFTRGETEQIPAVFHCVTNCISVGQFCQSIFVGLCKQRLLNSLVVSADSWNEVRSDQGALHMEFARWLQLSVCCTSSS